MIAPHFLGVFLHLMAIAAVPSMTQTDAGRISLRGLTGLGVSIETLSPDVVRQGITEAWLEERAARALRLAGCTVLERADARTSERMPLLIVQLQTVREPGRSAFAWHLSTSVHQMVWDLTCEDAQMFAQTWTANGSIGITSARSLRSSIQKTLDAQMDEFIQDWGRRAEKE